MKIETIIKQGDKFPSMTSAKCMRSWLNGQISKQAKGNTPESFQAETILRGVLNAYNHYHPEKNLEVEVISWKGKSSFELIKGIDKLTIIKYQKKDKDSEPAEIKTEVSKEELISLIEAIKLNKYYDSIETKQIAFQYCLNLGIKTTDKGKDLFEGDFWDNFFSWRSMHNKLTLMLGALDSLELIKYRGGKTKLLENNLSIQMIL